MTAGRPRAALAAGLAGLVCAGLLAAACGASSESAPRPEPGQAAASATIAPPVAVAPEALTASTAVSTAAAPRVTPTTPCTTNARAQYVFVSLHQQHMWMCALHRVAYSTAITSGMVGQYTETPTGTFAIQGRNRDTTLTLNTGATYEVKYWIPFQAPLFGFHDSPWQQFPYGSAKYRTAGSHGCVHMPLTAIKFLYNWATIGTAVRIRT